MADYQTIDTNELATASPPPVPSSYEPVNDNDMAPAMPPIRGMKGMPSYSSGVIARLRNGDPVTNTLSKIATGFSTGYGDAFAALTAQDQDSMIKAGIKPVTPEEMGTVHGALRFYGQSLGAAASVMQDAVLSIFPGALGAIEQGATQAAKEAGVENPERVGAEAAGFGEFMATDAHVNTMLMSRSQYAEATRIVRAPGGFIDQRIGPVPSHAEVPVQAASVADHYGLDIAPAIQKAYDGGVLPAEIFHDAKTDPTILPALAEGKVPEAYPVSDWTGGQMAPEAAGATAAARAPEGTPTPLTPAGKLPAGSPRPVAGTGDLATRGLSESTEAAAINKGLADEFEGLPTYQQVKDTDQGAAALKFLESDPEGAMQVAMGTKAAPKGLLPEAAYVAVKNKAVAEGDVDTLRTLATQSTLTQQATTMGQRISYLRNVNPENDPVAAISQVQQARAEALKAKGVDVPKAVNDEVAAAQTVTRQARAANANGGAWSDFIASITCK